MELGADPRKDGLNLQLSHACLNSMKRGILPSLLLPKSE
jgi:hypothetical protein